MKESKQIFFAIKTLMSRAKAYTYLAGKRGYILTKILHSDAYVEGVVLFTSFYVFLS